MLDSVLSRSASEFVGSPVKVSWVSMTDAVGKAYTLPDAYGIALDTDLQSDRVKSLGTLLHECGHIVSGHLQTIQAASKRKRIHDPAVATPDNFDKAWLEREAQAWKFAEQCAEVMRAPEVVKYCRQRREADVLRYALLQIEQFDERLKRLEKRL